MENSAQIPPKTAEPIIKVRGLRHVYQEGDGTKEVLVIIMGPSGSGKSTLLKLIGAQLTLQEGDIVIDGNSLRGADKNRLMQLRRNLGFIFQSHHLLNSLKVIQNVQLPLAFDPNATAKSSREDALKTLSTVGIADQADKFPTHLSGGQRQRVAIARAVAARPPIILADEPTGNLDSHSGKEVMKILHELNDEGRTIILITHDNEIAEEGTRVVRISDGRIIEDRPSNRV